ncbi:MAG: amidohydrolase family protein, partial [Chloroflexi bacterium]|nr:amidohydrolase family protein [Chloroflexota bacterium]
IKDEDLRIQCVKIYNDACADWQRESNNRLFPQAMLPLWDIDETVKEVRRIKEELHLTGVTVTDRTSALDVPDFSQPHWEPFWELINDYELPLDFHIGAGLTTLAPMDTLTWPSFSLTCVGAKAAGTVRGGDVSADGARGPSLEPVSPIGVGVDPTGRAGDTEPAP